MDFMEKFFRIDSTPKIKLDWEKTPSGIRAFGTIGKAELPLTYFYWDAVNGKLTERIETITDEELFKEDSLKSLWGSPVLLGHPRKKYFNYNEENLLIGSCLQEFLRLDDGSLSIMMQIHDRKGIDLIEQEMSKNIQAELSPAYLLRGTKLRSDGLYLQQGRKYDHIALLFGGEGRGKDELTLRTDKKDVRKYFLGSNELISKELVKEKKRMANLSIRCDDAKDRVFTEVDEELAGLVSGMQIRLDSAIREIADLAKKNKELQAEADRTKGEMEALRIKANELENTRLDASAINAEVSERFSTWDLVEPELKAIAQKNNQEFHRDGKLSASEIKKLYIRAKSPNIKLDGCSDEYVNGLFEGLKPRSLDRLDDAGIIQYTDTAFEILNNGMFNKKEEDLRTDGKNAREARRKKIEANGRT